MSSGSSSNPLPGDFPKTPKPPPRTPSRGRSRAITRSQTASKAPSRVPSPEEEQPSEPPSPVISRTTTPRPPTPPPPKNPIMSESSRKIPTLDVKLSGTATYPEWTISIKNYLKLVPTGEYRVWDIITGEYLEPGSIKTENASSSSVTDNRKMRRAWEDANAVALLTMRKNCEDDVKARIGNLESAKEAYEELKKVYEGQTATEFYVLLDSLFISSFDDRKETVHDHVASYERTWNAFTGVIMRADLTNDDGFGKGLKEFAKSDTAKAEFLLRSFPPFYGNTIENIRAKEHKYDDAVRKLKQFISAKQKTRRGKGDEGTQENPVVLKTDKKLAKDNGKRCDFCIAKGWKGLNHVESECYTKKREEKKKEGKTKKAKGEDSDNEDGVSICYVKVKGANAVEPINHFEYDTVTSHHCQGRSAIW